MKRTTFLLTVFFTVFLSSSDILAGNQPKEEESRSYPVKAFDKIYLDGAYRIYLIQGDTPGLEIRASDPDAFDFIDVDSNEETLKLRVKRSHFDFDRITLYVTFTNLEKLMIQGGARLKTKGQISVDDFYLKVEGGATVDISLKGRSVQVLGEGGVMFELEGEAETLGISLEGAGHVKADELKADIVNFSIEGVGTGTVYPVKELNATLNGVGKIRYRGDPEVNKSINGLGSVTKD